MLNHCVHSVPTCSCITLEDNKFSGCIIYFGHKTPLNTCNKSTSKWQHLLPFLACLILRLSRCLFKILKCPTQLMVSCVLTCACGWVHQREWPFPVRIVALGDILPYETRISCHVRAHKLWNSRCSATAGCSVPWAFVGMGLFCFIFCGLGGI